MKKAALRIEYSAKRKSLQPAVKEEMTERMKVHLMDFLKNKNIQCAMSFVPMQQQSEIDTSILEDAIRQLFPKVKIVYPKVNGDEMIAVLPEDITTFTRSKIGVREHLHFIPISPEAIDIILVPLLAIDAQGYRVGYGKGFYDRFLLQSQAMTIGLSFFEPIPAISDIHTSDIPVQYCLYPDGIIEF